MNKRLILELNNHNVYYVKTDQINYYITIPKNFSKTNICIDLKNKMDNYNLEENDEVWVLENVKNTYNYVDSYNITLVIPVFSKEQVSILEKLDVQKYSIIDSLLGYVINFAYANLMEAHIQVENQVVLINNDRYKTFINWFIVKYQNRIVCKNLLDVIRIFNVNATSYKKLETPAGMSFVVGNYTNEVDAPKAIPKEEPVLMPIKQKPVPQASGGFTSYLLLTLITIVVSAIVVIIALRYK